MYMYNYVVGYYYDTLFSQTRARPGGNRRPPSRARRTAAASDSSQSDTFLLAEVLS